jgi:hypothetical protein
MIRFQRGSVAFAVCPVIKCCRSLTV